MKKSIESMKEKSTSTMDEYALARKLAIVVATDFICWVNLLSLYINVVTCFGLVRISSIYIIPPIFQIDIRLQHCNSGAICDNVLHDQMCICQLITVN